MKEGKKTQFAPCKVESKDGRQSMRKNRRCTIYMSPHSQPRTDKVCSFEKRNSIRMFTERSQITTQERMFLEATSRGDKATVLNCLCPPQSVNVNASDFHGRTALQIAADMENVEIVEILLAQPDIQIGDALLYAIKEGVYRIVELMVNHNTIRTEYIGSNWSEYRGGCKLEPKFPLDLSPIMLAAQCNQFEILQLFIGMGVHIERPHVVTCVCNECQQSGGTPWSRDSLRRSLLRIHTYRALASSAWMSLACEDPICAAFELSHELSVLSRTENEFKEVYLQLCDQCQQFAVDLLNECGNSAEVIAVLSQGVSVFETSSNSEVPDLPRLKLALKYQQKQFVSHAHCQQLLTSIWFEGVPGWRSWRFTVKVTAIIALVLSLPMNIIVYQLAPHSWLGKLVFFTRKIKHEKSVPRQNQRGVPPSEIEVLITFWIFGMVWGECKQLWEEGLKGYIRQWWNWLDFIMLSLYLAAIATRAAAIFRVRSRCDAGPSEAPRVEWPGDDPTIVSESIYAVAVVFSFFRIIYLFQMSPHLGPLQISLGKMLIDIAKFMLIFFLVMISFTCGISQLYEKYDSKNSLPDGTVITNHVHYVDGVSAGVNLFFALFGLNPDGVSGFKLRIEKHHLFVYSTGLLLFGAYCISSTIVLINMLIAMMSNSYQVIDNHADLEWKFARTKLWMDFYGNGSTLPPPANLIISPKWIIRAISCLLKLFCQRGSQSSRCRSFPSKVVDGKNEDTESRCFLLNSESSYYQDVMTKLVTRYIHRFKESQKQDGVNEDDLNEIKQDISSLRYELRNDKYREMACIQSDLEEVRREMRSLGRFVSAKQDTEPFKQIVKDEIQQAFAQVHKNCAMNYTSELYETQLYTPL